MIITDLPYLTLTLTPEQETQPEATASGFVAHFIQHGAGQGCTIEPDSVVIVRMPATDTKAGTMTALWQPAQLELRGGPADGRVIPIERGMPPIVLTIQPEPFSAELALLDAGLTAMDVARGRATEATEYKRAGIDSDGDRWVYLPAEQVSTP